VAERCVNWLNQRRGVATRYEKWAENYQGIPSTRVRGRVQPVEKPLYAPSEHPSRTQKSRHYSVLALMSKCLDAVLDYPPVL
jgi:hypothetical protein